MILRVDTRKLTDQGEILLRTRLHTLGYTIDYPINQYDTQFWCLTDRMRCGYWIIANTFGLDKPDLDLGCGTRRFLALASLMKGQA